MIYQLIRLNNRNNGLFPGWILLTAILFLNLYSNEVHATHAAGADLTYRCLGGLVYEIEATFYRDCGGSAEPGSVTITYKSTSANYTRNVLASKVISGNGMEITLPCVSSPSNCTTGMNTGIRRWVYRATVTLPSARADWVFSYRVCCRNCSITTIQSPCAVNSEIYVEATLNNIAAPGNSSPIFNNIPLAFVCLGQNFNYNQGVSDADGDSISYELIDPKTSATTQVMWIPPASTQSPMASSTPFTMNSHTGDINFTPSAMQIGILAVRVNEFRNGILIGSTIRDIQMYTQFCTNTIPSASGINGSDNYDTTACVGQQLCFTISAQDADINQVTTFNTFNPISGSSITQSPSSLEFCWTPTAADAGPSPHIFTVTIKDNACPFNGVQTFSYVVYVSEISVNTTSTNPVCYNAAAGTASVTVNGTPPFSYSWNSNPVQQSGTATGLTAGNYSVVVTSAEGCSATGVVTINNPVNPVQVNCTTSGIITCESGNIATVQASASGGTAPYGYLWNTGNVTASVPNLGSGSYYVTVTDANGCTSTDSVTVIPAVGSVILQTGAIGMVSCYGGNNGSVNIIATGGSPPYNYSWSNGASSSSLNNLNAGNFSVSVSDINGCSASLSVIISQPDSAIGVQGTVNDVKCFGLSTGAVNLQVSGGNAPYNFNWSNGASAEDISGLSSGNYTVLITDANGCTLQQSYSVSQPAVQMIPVVSSVQEVSCYGSANGSIQVSATGGLLPYNFQWNNGTTGQQLNNVAAGNYTVTITDANLCDTMISIPVSQPAVPLLALPVVSTHVPCFGTTGGQIDLTVNGGTAPYTFNWSNGNVNEDISNLTAGTYGCTITDSHGCSTSVSSVITQPAQAVAATVNITGISCYNIPSGSATVNATGGTAPYNYQWSNGSTTGSLSNLAAATYTVTVTDANGCTAMMTQEITQPDSAITVVVSTLQIITCFNSNNGSMKATPTGGSAPFNFKWSTGQETQVVEGLSAGSYTVTITDNNGCSANAVTVISQPPTIALNAIITPASCISGQGGLIRLNVSGGTPGYLYTWNNGVTHDSIVGLPGNYSVVVTDANNCTATGNYNIASEGNMQVQVNGAKTICTGETARLITDSIPGAVYQWYYDGEILNGATAMEFITPAAGFYSVSVTTPCGTFMSDSVEVQVKTISNVSVSNTQIICPPETAQLIASGGTTYEWNPPTYITFTNTPDPVVSPLQTTLYSVKISNEFGCMTTLTTEVAVVCDSLLVPTGFSPNDDGTNDGYVIDGIENYPGNKLWIYNRWGKLVYKATDYNNSWNGMGNISGISAGKKVPSGTYYYILDLNDHSKPRAGYLIIRGS